MDQEMMLAMPFKIKEEIESDGEDVQCRLCHKTFANPVALRNHASMDHVDAFEKGDPSVWTKTPETTYVKAPKKLPKINMKRKIELLSSVPAAVTGKNVSYIIVKSESSLAEATRRGGPKKEREPKKPVTPKRAKAVQAIGGPFECLEPSPLGADGVCHQIFFSCCEYSLHARLEHTKRRRAPRCQVCERTLPSRRGDDENPYGCDMCGTSFPTDEELETHMSQAHVKVKPYACGVCHKRFTQQGGVLQHMRMHTGERPFPCTVCDKAFTQKSGLDQHMRTHTKDKPYRCVVCSKAFIQSVHLKQHMRTHTNVAPFQCGICDKRFKQSSHLNYHLKNHNPANMTPEKRAVYEVLVGQITRDLADTDTDQHEVLVGQITRDLADTDTDHHELLQGGEVEVEIQESAHETYVIEAAGDELHYQD